MNKHKKIDSNMERNPDVWPYLERHFKKIFYAILAVAALLYGSLNPMYKTGFYNDDAVYVMVARDLWNNSASHWYPPIRPDFPLPGLPLVLAPLAHLVEPHWTLLDWMTVVMTLVSVGLLGMWARRWMSAGETLIVMGLYAFNPIVARFSGIVAPSPYYAVAVLGSFLLMDGLLEKPSVSKALALGFLLGWGSVVRPEGFVLLVSVVSTLLMVKRQKDYVRMMGVPLAGWGMFLWAWFRLRPIGGSEYGRDLAALGSYWSDHLFEGTQFVGTMVRYIFVDVLTTINVSLYPSYSWFGWLLGGTVVFGIGWGFQSLWKKRKVARPELLGVAIFCGLYLLAHLYWRVIEQRYFIPLLPFVIAFLVHGFVNKITLLKGRKVWVVSGLVCLGMLYTHDNVYSIYESLHSPDPMNAPPWKSLQWLKHHTPSAAKVLSIVGPNVALYAQRTSICSVKAERFESFRYRIRRQNLQYIVDRNVGTITTGAAKASNPNTVWGQIRLWQKLYPERLQIVFEDPVEKTTIYQYIPESGFMRAFEKYQLAAQDYDAGRFGEAYEMAGHALALYPKLGSAINMRGTIKLMRNQLIEAESDFLKAANLRPDSPIARVNLATLCFLRGQPGPAEEYLRQAREAAERGGRMALYSRMVRQLRPFWAQNKGMVFTDDFVPMARRANEDSPGVWGVPDSSDPKAEHEM